MLRGGCQASWSTEILDKDILLLANASLNASFLRPIDTSCRFSTKIISVLLTVDPVVQVADIFRPGRMTVCLTAAAASPAHLSMSAPKGYTALGSSVQKLPGGATAIVQSLQLPKLGSVLTDEPDVAGRAMSEVRAHVVCCRGLPRQHIHLQPAPCKPQPGSLAL